MRGQRSHEILVASTAALIVLVHLALARVSIEDIDSINFALGVRTYDVARHQPHPPGYPVYIAATRMVAWLIEQAAPSVDPILAALVGLAGLSGGIAVVALRRVLVHAGCSTWTATGSALAFACAPLPWLTAARPLSDMPGLAAALVAQAWLLHLVTRGHPPGVALVGAAGAWAGLAVGFRSQVMWLTLPLLAAVALWYLRAAHRRAAAALSVGAVLGALGWAVPMVALSGGPAAYLAALRSQAGDDFDGVPMLVLDPSPGRLLTAVADSFVQPWTTPWLAAVTLGLAVVGLAAVARHSPRVLWLATLLWGPYALFHMLFQETETTRYALPLVVPVVVLAVSALDLGGRRIAPRAVAPVAIVWLGVLTGVSLRAHHDYIRAPESVSDAIREMKAEAMVRPPGQVLVHRRVWAETRRARQMTTLPGLDDTPAPRAFEWAALRPVMGRPRVYGWWLVDPQRGDRAAVDPRALRLRERFAWPDTVAPLLGGMRPRPFDWYVVEDPAWVLDEGWALTPELAGLAQARGRGPASPDGARAIVRRTLGPRTLLLGGRVVGPQASAVQLTVTVGDHWQADVRLDAGGFTKVWTLPAAGSRGDGITESELLVARVGEAAAASPATVLLEQFDIQPSGVPVVALGDGWFEPERDVTSGRRWRWMTTTAVIDVWGADCDLQLTLRGTWPRHYEEAPVLTVQSDTAGTLFEGTLPRPFAISMTVPRRARVDGRVTLTLLATQSFVAGQRTGSADARRLALEMADVLVEPLSGGRSCTADVDSTTHESVVFPRSTTRGTVPAATSTAPYSRSQR